MSRVALRAAGLFGRIFAGRSSEATLTGARLPRILQENLEALTARPCLAPDWRPMAVSVHDRRYREARRAHRYHGEVVAQITGAPPVRMLCHDDDIVAYTYFFFGRDSYESLSLRLFAGFAERGGAVLDIGAYTGLFGLVAARVGAGAEVIGFEPAPHIAERARLNGALNGLTGFRVETKAISGESGRAGLTLYGESSATTGASLASKPRSDIGVMQVDVTTVDEVAAGLSAPVRLIKLDTEGDEPSAMDGAAKTLAASRPVVLSEVLRDDAVRVQCAKMAAYGYQAWYINERGRRLARVNDGFSLKARGYGNLIFLAGKEDRQRAKALTEAFRAEDFIRSRKNAYGVSPLI